MSEEVKGACATEEILRAIEACPATRTVSTRYIDHAEWEHGLPQGSPPCTCGVRVCRACPICGREMPAAVDACSPHCLRVLRQQANGGER